MIGTTKQQRQPKLTNATFEKQLLAHVLRDPTFLPEHPEVRAELFRHDYCRLLMGRVQQHVDEFGRVPTAGSLDLIIESELDRPNVKAEQRRVLTEFVAEVRAVDLTDRDYVGGQVKRWAGQMTIRQLALDTATAIDLAEKTGELDVEPLKKKWLGTLNGVTTGRSQIKFINPDDIETPEARWAWDGVLEAGMVSILSAFAKTGKTELAYGLALAVARGEAFLGRSTTQGPVLVLAVEEHEKMVKRRLIRYGWRPSDPILVHVGRAGEPAAAIGELRKVIDGMTPKPALILLDTLTRFWGIENENDARETSPHLELWTDAARATDAHVMLIHHDNKSGGPHGRQIRGSGDILSAVDYGLTLNRLPNADEDDPRRVLTALGRYEDPVPRMLMIYDPQTGYRLLDGPPPKLAKVRSDPEWDRFKEEFPEDAELTVEEMVDRFKLKSRKVANRLIEKAASEGEGWLIEGDERKPTGKGGGRPSTTWRRR